MMKITDVVPSRSSIPSSPTGDAAKVIPLLSARTVMADIDEEADAHLLARVAQRDHAAFATLVQRHTARFFRVAYRFVHHSGEAEDIVQDAFLKLWERPDAWHAGKNAAFTTWFYRIIVNQCIDFSRKKRPVALLDETLVEDERQSHEQTLLKNEQQKLLAQLMTQLPDRQRCALNLCFYEELSNQQAADIMGIHLKALQALLMRAKATLKKSLKHREESAPHAG